MSFDNKDFLNASRMVAFISLGILFSTNYYGGNALFFIDASLLSIIKVLMFAIGMISITIYFYFKSKENEASTETLINGRLYSKQAINSLKGKPYYLIN